MNRNALVVDDTPANRDFLVRLLTQAKFNVKGAACGQDALDIIYQPGADITLAMIDMQLPDMSGLQLTMRLRERFGDALIVVATMYDDHMWKKKSFEAGCDIFLVKPNGFMDLFRRLTTTDIAHIRAEGATVIDHYGVRPFGAAVG
ncbi:MAG: response regulator transcription factor [Phototrophicaceae bacterium]|jgi:DNA-binding response OmpR family regulator